MVPFHSSLIFYRKLKVHFRRVYLFKGVIPFKYLLGKYGNCKTRDLQFQVLNGVWSTFSPSFAPVLTSPASVKIRTRAGIPLVAFAVFREIKLLAKHDRNLADGGLLQKAETFGENQ